ncbi:MAG TPA: alginate lyase family protein [Gaiellaceae bacterium]|nr:alginate lyase family protein [Gaiellaceae bacterium]
MRLWLHALRVVRPRQALARATRPVRRRRFPQGPSGPLRALQANEPLWRSPAFAPLGAQPEPGSRLARFHAGYGEDVLEAAREGGDALTPARAWIAAYPPRRDDLWHPYVASTRAANWIAAATLDPALRPVIAESVRRALARVAANVEDDVLGNHVIRNAKALVLGGVAFDDAALRRRGEALLRRELPEQVLADGGHYERSPAYHRLVLRDLLELRPFVDVEDEVERMARFAAASSRPDGAPALFNDGGLDVAPRLELPRPPTGMSVFEETGYVFVNEDDLWLAFDCGPPSPPFLPAHAHADALSFQLWFRGRAVVVDPGMPVYEAGAERDFLRSTAAHSTVCVGGGQFERWGAFRAGPLPDVRLVEADATTLAGRVRDARGVGHERRIRLRRDRIEVEDELAGVRGRSVRSTLVVAEDVGATIAAAGDTGREPRTISERFGERRPAAALVQHGAGSWTIER